ncbi:P27 family phage terminase small subunit [Bradyrhizobium sp. CIR3A]|uniref:P27 family phage terminase small subunit n=1 Tax=Bradyrhizobium sp. CIR3A TaxID=2663838 RepID=UPI0016068D60
MAKTPEKPALFATEEPDWSCLFGDELEQQFASKHWRIYLDAMRDAGTISRENLPSLERLVSVQVLWDRSMRQMAEHGVVIAPRKRNSRAIARVSPHFAALRGLGAEALALESELGITPRSRSKVSPARRRANRAAIGGGYLQVVK